MRPWLLVAGDFSPTGGMDRANYHLAMYLAESGREVTLVGHRVAPSLADHPRVRVVPVRRPLGLHALGAPLLDWAGRSEARRLLTSRPDACVLVNGANCLTPAVNWVHVVHDAYPCSDDGAPLAFRLKNRILRAHDRRRERKALALSPLVLANSDKTRAELLRLGVPPERVRVVYLGTDPEQFRPATAEERVSARREFGLGDGPVVLFAGALGHDRNKGFDTLLRAWRSVPNRDALLVAAGGGRIEWWQRQAEALGSSSVRLVGHTPRVAALMAAADLFVSPTRYDAYGLAVHESLCRGVPALVSRAAGIAERYPVELADLILPDAENAGDLAERIGRCLADLPGLRQRVAPLGESLRKRTWDEVSAEIVELVEGRSPCSK